MFIVCSKSCETWRLASLVATVFARAWLLALLLLLLLPLCGEVRFCVVEFCVVDVGIFICPPKMKTSPAQAWRRRRTACFDSGVHACSVRAQNCADAQRCGRDRLACAGHWNCSRLRVHVFL